MTNFSTKYLTVIIGIGSGSQGDQAPVKDKIYTLTNHRVTAEISAYGGETQGEAKVRIYGMSRDLMNALTTIGPVMVQIRAQNSIQILAGDNPNALATIYNGTIQEAFADYNEAPDVALSIRANSASIAALTNVQSYSHAAPTPVTLVMSTIANNLKWANFDPGDVTAVLGDVTYSGSYLEQIKACANAADIDYVIESKGITNRLRIKTRYSSFSGDQIIISPQTNMIGYPVYSQSTMIIKSLFLPNIALGGLITVQGSAVDTANGTWIVNSVHHDLESYVPNGKWYTTCGVFPSNLKTG
jgi:hypothetical protein